MTVKKTNQLNSVTDAVEFIESNLDQELSTDIVASHVGFSPYYFHRLFAGVLGESVAEYIRKRRLSESAHLVRSTDKTLLEIGLMYGFESQEVFTRAFKKMFGITPGRYRSLREIAPYPDKFKASVEMLEHLQGGLTMQPKIVTRESELVVGMGGAFQQGDSRSIGKLWDRFLPRKHDIKAAKKTYAVGVCTPTHPQIKVDNADQFVYISALPVTSIKALPEGMVSCELAAGRYAVFTHKGPISEIGHTLNYIWGTWLPKGEFEHRDAPDFELYDDRFDPDSAESEFDFYVPIK
jgi:AraC family transcriptional regulator